MEITTKYGIGQRIWVISHSKATPIEVKVITVTEKGIGYGDSTYPTYPETECFPTKEALGKYVMNS